MERRNEGRYVFVVIYFILFIFCVEKAVPGRLVGLCVSLRMMKNMFFMVVVYLCALFGSRCLFRRATTHKCRKAGQEREAQNMEGEGGMELDQNQAVVCISPARERERQRPFRSNMKKSLTPFSSLSKK